MFAYAYHRERDLPSIRESGLFNTVGPHEVRPTAWSAALGPSGSGRRARHCVRRRHPDEVLLPRERCRWGTCWAARTSLVALADMFNVGSSEEISIEELARVIIARTGSSSPLVHLPYDVAYEVGFEDMTRRVPDVAKIRSFTGWRAQRTLADVLDDVIAEVQAEREPLATPWPGTSRPSSSYGRVNEPSRSQR